MNMGRGPGESGQYIHIRIMFMTRRKCKFRIPTNGPLHEFRLLARIVEQVVSRQGNGYRKTAGVSEGTPARLHLAVHGLEEGLQLFVVWTIRWGGELIFMSDSW